MNRPGESPGNQFRSGGIGLRETTVNRHGPRLPIPPSGDHEIGGVAQPGRAADS